MENSKNYTVMELAELIGVPRTTINDWLNRYGQYVVSIPQGKRKVYPESTLKILLQVAQLRNEGRSFVQIEKELEQNFPIKAEYVMPSSETAVPAPEKSPGGEQNGEGPVSSGSVPRPGADPDGAAPVGTDLHESSSLKNEFALIARRQSEEITHLIGESFRNMDQRIRELEQIARIRKKVSYIWFGAFLVFLLLLACVSLGAWHFLNKSAREREILQYKQNKSARAAALLREQTVTLIAESKNFKSNAARLEKELARQKKEFEKNLESQRKNLTELHKAREQSLDARRAQALSRMRENEMKHALEKERFAAERLAMLKELDSLKKRLAARQEKVSGEKKKNTFVSPAVKKNVRKAEKDKAVKVKAAAKKEVKNKTPEKDHPSGGQVKKSVSSHKKNKGK